MRILLLLGDFGMPTLDALLASQHRPVCVVVATATEAPTVGRPGEWIRDRIRPLFWPGILCPLPRDFRPWRALEILERAGIPHVKAMELHASDLVRLAATHQAELLLSVGYPKILPPPVLAAAPRGGMNVHPSLLPRYRGPSPVFWQVVLGETRTGVTIHRLTAEVDEGPILSQVETRIGAEETAGALFLRLARLAGPVVLKTLGRLEAGDVAERAQAPASATFQRRFREEDSLLDWSRPAEDLARLVRACNPFPGARSSLPNGESVRIWRATVAAGPAGARCGEIVALRQSSFDVTTGSGVLRVRTATSDRRHRYPTWGRAWPTLIPGITFTQVTQGDPREIDCGISPAAPPMQRTSGDNNPAELAPTGGCSATIHSVSPTRGTREGLERVACPLCSARVCRPRHQVYGYAIGDCLVCALTFVNPQPTDVDLASFYETIFHTPAWYRRFPHLQDFDYFGEAASDDAGHGSYVELVRPLVPHGAWLDVGCGHGRLASLAAAAGYEAFGVDPNPLAVQAARQRLGPDRVFAGSVEDAGLPADRFTVVSLIGTIEHLKRPLQTLQEIFRILEPGGLILVQTPNLASLQYRRQGAGWEQFTPPGHLVYFTPRTLRRMLQKAAFHRMRFDMRFPLEAGWDYGCTRRPRHPNRLGRLLAGALALLGSRCELAAQRVKGRLVGKHDIVCHARKPRSRRGGRG